MTSPRYTAKTLSPILPVSDMDIAVGFYTDVLGFNSVLRSPEYSIVRREGASLHLTKAADEGVLTATRGHMSIYLAVQDIGVLWAHASQFKGRYKIRDLFNREYGMCEFHICDPDGCLIFIGEEIGAG